MSTLPPPAPPALPPSSGLRNDEPRFDDRAVVMACAAVPILVMDVPRSDECRVASSGALFRMV